MQTSPTLTLLANSKMRGHRSCRQRLNAGQTEDIPL
jgi:hypothetical protein